AGAPLSRDRPVGSRPCSGIHDFRRSAGLYACRGKRLCQAPRRASGGGGVHRARGHRPRESPRRPKGCRVNSGPGPETSCGFAALIGAPNAGKSTLINQLVGTKVSIVSRKVQTTRGTVRGIALEGTAQIIYVDTPGIFAPKLKSSLGSLMPPGPWLYPEDQISDMPLRLLAAEITREKIFERLHDELPYASAVETELWKDMPDGS